MLRITMLKTCVWMALLAMSGVISPLVSQEITSDSVAALTRKLQAGTLIERARASWALEQVAFDELPPSTHAAILTEFNRINDLMRADAEIPGIEELVGEDFGAYYGTLADFVYEMEGPEIHRALARSAGGGIGLLQKAAEAGDEIIHLLSERIRDDFAAPDALETMAYAWFWADSTGAQLSEQSRKTILEHLLAATRVVPADPGISLAIKNTREPGFIAVARAMVADPRQTEASFFLEEFAIPALEEVARRRSDLELVEGAARSLDVLCSGVTSGRRQGACRSLESEFQTALRHLREGRTQPARNVLQAILKNAEAAAASGGITEQEQLLVTGPITYLLAR